MDVSFWIQKVLESYQECDEQSILKFISDTDISDNGDVFSDVQKCVAEVIEDDSEQQYFIKFAANLAMFKIQKQKKSPILTAFSHLDTSIKEYCKFYQSSVLSGSWSARIIDYLCKTIKELAYMADKTYQK